MTDIEKNKILKAYLDVAVNLAEKVLISIEDPKKTTFHVMLWSYLKKQIHHSQSVKKLGNSYDVLLIVRTMIEALCQMYWTSHDSDKRSELWSDYRHVYNFKLLLQKKESNFNVAANEQDILKHAKVYAQKHLNLNRNKIDSLQNSTLLDNPFNKSWTATSIFQIMSDVQAIDLYLRNYFFCSEWAHSSVSIMEQAMYDTNNIENSMICSTVTENLALVMSFQSVFETSKMCNDYFKLSFSNDFSKLHSDFLAWHDKITDQKL